MATSGSGLVFLVCFWAGIGAAVFSVQPVLAGRLSVRTPPAAGWVAWLAVVVPSLLQFPFPGLYDAWHRDATAVLDGHQWWRVATALVVQDGGVAGTVSNLTLWAVALLICIPLWGARATLVTASLAGVGLNVAAVLAGAYDGAGNSAATLVLLASLPAFAFAALPDQRWRGAVGAVVIGAAAIVLVTDNNGHGVAVIVGLVLGAVGMPYARRRARDSEALL